MLLGCSWATTHAEVVEQGISLHAFRATAVVYSGTQAYSEFLQVLLVISCFPHQNRNLLSLLLNTTPLPPTLVL